MTKRVKQCRICFSNDLFVFLPLGKIPLPNGFIKLDSLKEKEPTYPLTVGACRNCGLVQLMDIVNPEKMFRNYVYIPSASKTRMDNFANITQTTIEKFGIKQDSLVIDIGSNDGSLLSFFKGKGIKTLGIDPATNLAKIAELKGIETINDYVSKTLARKIVKKMGHARVITATNVVAHISDLYDLFASVAIMLQDDGVFICEFPYLLDLLKNTQFDTIYHEHLSYFSLKPLMHLLKETSLQLFDIERRSIDGGSLRVFISKKNKAAGISQKIEKMLKIEEEEGLYDEQKLRNFSNKVKRLKTELVTKLKQLKLKKKSIAGVGAAAKGNILLNYCKIDHKLLDFIVDSTQYKQGLYTPGTHIPIYPESELLLRKPDYTLILAWNFVKEIMEKNRSYTTKGGKFIIPVPEVKVI